RTTPRGTCGRRPPHPPARGYPARDPRPAECCRAARRARRHTTPRGCRRQRLGDAALGLREQPARAPQEPAALGRAPRVRRSFAESAGPLEAAPYGVGHGGARTTQVCLTEAGELVESLRLAVLTGAARTYVGRADVSI